MNTPLIEELHCSAITACWLPSSNIISYPTRLAVRGERNTCCSDPLPPLAVTAFVQAVALSPTAYYMDIDDSYQMYAGGIYSGGTCGTNPVHARKERVVGDVGANPRVWEEGCAEQTTSTVLRLSAAAL